MDMPLLLQDATEIPKSPQLDEQSMDSEAKPINLKQDEHTFMHNNAHVFS